MGVTEDPNINCAPTVFPGFLEENTGSQLLRGINLNDPKQH